MADRRFLVRVGEYRKAAAAATVNYSSHQITYVWDSVCEYRRHGAASMKLAVQMKSRVTRAHHLDIRGRSGCTMATYL